mgnify:CR=1 FL=1
MTPHAALRAVLPLLLALLSVTAPLAAEPPMRVSRPFEISPDFLPGDRYMAATLLGSLVLSGAKIDGLGLHELSGLAWDEDEGLLYAVSDTGALFHLVPRFEGTRLVDIDAVAAFRLSGPDGAPLNDDRSDAEALAIENGANGVSGDTRLFISFEQTPRIAEHRPDGAFVADVDLPPTLADASVYAKPNQQLEALARHPDIGLVTAPQKPITGAVPDLLTLYDLEGREWRIEPLDPDHSAVVALEPLPGGDLMVLERRYASFFQPVIFRLLKVTPGTPDRTLTAETLVTFDSSKDFRVDNFEGLARHRGGRFFLVSDDNRNFVQKTLLLYLKFDMPGQADGDAPDPAAAETGSP